MSVQTDEAGAGFVPEKEQFPTMRALLNSVVSRYFVKKHSWRGKYFRAFCITANSLVTVNPSSSEVTNTWDLKKDLISVEPSPKSDEEFVITYGKGGKSKDKTTFSTPFRSQLLCDLLRARPSLSPSATSAAFPRFNAEKIKRSGDRKRVVLEVRPWGLAQVNDISGLPMATYNYHHIERIALVTDLVPGGVLLRYSPRTTNTGGPAANVPERRFYMFACERKEDLVIAMCGAALQCLGVRITYEASTNASVTKDQVVQAIRAVEEDSVYNTLAEFSASKHSPARHADPSSRLITISDKWFVERNPGTYGVVTMRPLMTIEQVVRPLDDPQGLVLLYRDGSEAKYSSPSREQLLACLIDCIRAAGNKDVALLPESIKRGLRMTPPGVLVDDNVESQLIKALAVYSLPFDASPAEQSESGQYVAMLISTFNANVPYSGPRFVDSNRQHKQSITATTNIITAALTASARKYQTPILLLAALQAIRRFSAVRSVFEAFTDVPLLREKLIALLREVIMCPAPDEFCLCAALDVISALIVPGFDFGGDTALQTTDATNKRHILEESDLMSSLISLFSNHVKRGTAPMVVMGCVEVLTAVLCPPGSDTTDAKQFISVLEQVARIGRDFFKLFHQGNCLSVVKGAGTIMRTIIDEGGDIPSSPAPPTSPVPPVVEPAATPAATATETKEEKETEEKPKEENPKEETKETKETTETSQPPPKAKKIRDMTLVSKMQMSALAEGATLRHLHTALFSKTTTQRQALFKDLSCSLVSYWITGCPAAEQMLCRVLPPALVYYLESTESVPAQSVSSSQTGGGNAGGMGANSAHNMTRFWDSWMKKSYPARPPAELRQKTFSMAVKKKNWAMLFYQIKQDHARADLVWNNHTREELREALETELRVFRQEQELAADGYISWNHSEFIVPYECLHRELNVGGYYLRLLMNPVPGQKAPVLRNPAEFFDMLFHRTLLEREGDLQSLCLQAMSVVYKYYSSKIGLFRDVAHMVALLRQCTDRVTRDRLLQLFAVLLDVEGNAKLFIDYGGITLLVDLLTLVHLHMDHVVAPAQSNLLTAGPNRAEGEWYYSIVTPGEKLADGTETPPKKERFGPKNIPEMRDLFAQGVVTASTLCWAQGMDDWKAVNDIVQLRWSLLATNNAILSPTELAGLLLEMLTKLCKLYPIRDSDGGIIRPVPRPKRQLSSPQLLPHVVQTFLTFDPALVDKTACLLDTLLEDNAASVPKSYLTGLFFFCCFYSGSNITNIVRLMKRIHLQQHFRSEGDPPPTDISSLSILSPLLPPAMIHLLQNRSAEEWTQVFLGNSDTPEAIWNHEMRGLLIDRIVSHLGNFPQRLGTNPRAVYQFVPIAPITYKQLDEELFCHHYYLRNFCDLIRFPEWPVTNEIEFLQSLLLLWSKETEKVSSKPGMSEAEAAETLKLKPNWKEDDLRRAYFRIAKEFHPDKNPEGRPVFQKASEAYTILCNRSSNGEDSGKARLSLIIRAQSILYARFKKQLAEFKYAGFPLLLTGVRAALAADDRPAIHLAAELSYRTIASTSLNAEELRRQEGLELFSEVLSKLVGLVMPDTKSQDPLSQSLANVLLIFATAAGFEKCREKIAESTTITRDVCYCLKLNYLPKVVEGALECVCCFSLDTNLSTSMMQLSVLLLVFPLIFKYDWTLAETDVIDAASTGLGIADSTVTTAAAAATNQQQTLNVQAQLALLSVARLGGLDPACDKPIPLMAACVKSMLSAGIANIVCKKNASDVLKILNTNVETPTLLWNSACRTELLAFIEAQQLAAARHTSDIDGESNTAELTACQSFVFKTLAKELQIGGVYVRLFNEQAKEQNLLPDPRGFCTALVGFIFKEAPRLTEATLDPEVLRKKRAEATPALMEKINQVDLALEHMRMASEGLRNLLRATRGMDSMLAAKGAVRAVFTMLSISVDQAVQKSTLETIGMLTKTADCLTAIAEAKPQPFLAPVLCSPCQPLVLDALTTLSSMLGNSMIVADCLTYGTLCFLLKIFATPTERGGDGSIRTHAAAAISKMTADPTHGSRVQIAVCKFLPAAMLGAMRQDPEQSVKMFDTINENPELIWTPGTRTQLLNTVTDMCKDLYARQRANRDATWGIQEDYKLVYDELKDEIELGGVYLRLFLKQPSWSLRNPKGFMEALLTKHVDLCNQAARDSSAQMADQLKTINSASVSLLSSNPLLCDHAAKTGHLAKILSLMENPALPKQASSAAIVSVLTTSQLCVDTMSTIQSSVHALLTTMQANPDQACLRAMEAMERVFSKCNCTTTETCVVAQLLNGKGVLDTLMDVLEGKHDMKLGSDAAEVKAHTVSALQKAIERDAVHGAALKSVLESNHIWSSYRGQRHDLFLPSSGQQIAGLLTGGSGSGTGGAGGVGLLTNVPHSSLDSNAPPDLI